MKNYRPAIMFLLSILGIVFTGCSLFDKNKDSPLKDLVQVNGGTFLMGDVYGEGGENERPVHKVTLSDFLMAKYEVTIGDFGRFVEETGYKTSAEAPDDPDKKQKMIEKFTSGNLTREEMLALRKEYLKLSGTGYWDAKNRRWEDYRSNINWKNPGINQEEDEPVLAVSPEDAMHYCNWLSKKAGLPCAYNVTTGELLDEDGNPTTDVTQVRGLRLPTEAEWEYAAREGGRKVRFGNGQDIARSSGINFQGDVGDYDYLELGEYRMGTTAVGSFPPNSLGLYDMSGNVWEWTDAINVKYGSEDQIDPWNAGGEMHALRGGRWGGDAFEARAFHRSFWIRNDRCNNSGFRIVKSK